MISGNANVGVDVQADFNVVAGNFVGTGTTGTAALGNINDGVRLGFNSNLLGGTTATTPGGPCTGSCILISGNVGFGVNASSRANRIEGNYHYSAPYERRS